MAQQAPKAAQSIVQSFLNNLKSAEFRNYLMRYTRKYQRIEKMKNKLN